MMMIREKGRFIGVLSLIMVFALINCASVEKRYKKGQELESKGRLEEAAQRYIKVLAKDPSMQDARVRLENVGAQLIDTYLEQAHAYESTGAYESAVSALSRIDNLRRRTSQVGVVLSVPDGYEDFQEEMIDAAVASLFEQGEYHEQTGNWAEALRKYERLRAYPLTPAQARRAEEAQAGVHIKWAEQDIGRAYFRAAFGRAQKAIDIIGPESEIGRKALQLQQAALEAGTRSVAVLPFWASVGAVDEAPRGMESNLYDTLLYEYLSQPVLFVAPIDPGVVHRELRRLRLRSGEITRQTASMVGLTLNTDFVVVGWIESYSFDEGIPEEIECQASLRRDRSTQVTYIERRYGVDLTAQVVYQVIDPRASRIVGEDTVAAKVSGQFRRCHYDGDYTTLDLSREERMLFNKEAWLQAEEEMETLLYNELAERIAASIFARVLAFIR